MPAVMVQGVSSGAGKSLVVTALCRWLARRDVRVAPFKAQNLSNNARVVEGGEIGTAQWLQAMAAGVTPDVRMNPILLKPEGDVRSQVVVDGIVDPELTRMPWRGRSRMLWPRVEAAYRSLADEFDVVVIEGAGSPAETNLWDDDIANMAVAELAAAPVLLVAGVELGGAFAHLYGTWALLPHRWQRRVQGFLLNKFRGDAALLEPAPATLAAATGVPTIGVLPMLDHALPAEEGPSIHVRGPAASSFGAPRVAIITGPSASNLDEFVPLQRAAAVTFVAARARLDDVDLVVLPGSKHVAGDRRWLASTGLDAEIRRAARAGTAILGICGGLQMLGHRIDDPHDLDGSTSGLGLLELDTTFGQRKVTRRTRRTFAEMPAPWSWLSHRTVDGYEIRFGATVARSSDATRRAFTGGGDEGYVAGNLLGITVHGLFENVEVLSAFGGAFATGAERVFDELADALEQHVDTTWFLERTRS